MKWVGKTAKWIGVTILFVALLEVWARVDDWITWGAPFFETYTHETLRVADLKGFHNRPNAQFQKWVINSQGFRGPEVSKDKPAGVTRVMVVGASEAFGLHESPGMEFPAQMQTILDSLRPGQYEVINAACVGLTPPRIDYYYQSWLSEFHPDIVAYYPSPSFYLDDEPPPDSTDWEFVSAWRPKEEWRLEGKLKIVLKGFIPMSWQIPVQEWQMQRSRNNIPDDQIFHTVPEDRMNIMRRQVAELLSTLKKDSAGILLATHVSRFGDSLSTEDERHLLGANQYFRRASRETLLSVDSVANDIFRRLARDSAVALLDLEDHLSGEDEYFADASHFTDLGARRVAEAFVVRVLEMTEGHARSIAPDKSN